MYESISNSSDIKMYKILSKNPNLVRKLTEIEDNPEIKPHLEKISELSQNIEKIGKTYGCQNGNDLIKKLCPKGIVFKSIDSVADLYYGKGNNIPKDGG